MLKRNDQARFSEVKKKISEAPEKPKALIRVWSNFEDGYVEYLIPRIVEARKYIGDTWGQQYDKTEKKLVEGGLPLIWEKV
jgi:hypothetical protein